ncbi:pyruvate decarboxylase [Choiromyces venosus 120613-1]|uniref:Pyruvate decarboxylase n=1 Tax=Choiromyces venosus 120613-1 TaxID=1336337 RepID=A0A3N4JLV3_9PEZI|nr:pyruvate decarboxylase [Choiromyces venosus 120613-1]
MASSSENVSIGMYLFKRLHELGGDFNLAALDLLPDAGLYWVGNCNELNAAYAADGYARIKEISALITTFGVGELSALAGVAGSYSEHVPVVHIVGIPNTVAQRNGLLLHHTLGNGDFTVFQNMSRNISVTSTILNDPHRAASEIDRVLSACWVWARPVYIGLPTDIVFKEVPASCLNTPLNLKIPDNEPDTESEVVDEIACLMYNSKNTIILADACAIRHRVLDELHELVEKTQLPTFVSPMGKGAVNEEIEAYGGVYVGDVSRDEVRQRVDHAELILYVGGLQSDFNSGGFTYRISRKNTVEFHSDHTKVRYSEFPGIQMKPLLRKLLDKLDYSKVRSHSSPEISNTIPHKVRESLSQEISHAWLWPRVGQWLREGDVIITETGTSNFGIWETRFPKNVTAISQVLWGSIGYSVGALQGAALACKEKYPERRVILFVGDGSLQLTVQEISTMIRHGLKPIIFVINNKGYTIERMIHGMEAIYNDIQPWNHTDLLKVFGADASNSKSYQCKSKTALENLFEDENFSSAPYIQLVEIFMPWQDAPRALIKIGRVTANLNEGSESE